MADVRGVFLAAMSRMPEATAFAVGFSGGADSALLTVLMREYCAERGLPLYAIHVNHGIRGAEADRDEGFCRSFCAQRSISLTVVKADVPALAKREKIGVEAAARKARYDAFRSFLRDLGGDALLATAHNADDNLETVLLHMLRGTGLAGLCGIAPLRKPFIRPLLEVSAADIRAFCQKESIPFVVDSTNRETEYSRNYLRAAVVPALRKIAPDPAATVGRMTSLLREDEDFLTAQTEARLGAYAAGTEAPLGLLSAMDRPLLARAIARLYANADETGSDLTAGHIRELASFIAEGKRGCVSLPHGITARVVGGRLSMERKTALAPPPEGFSAPLHEGDNPFPAFGFTVRLERLSAPEAERPDGGTPQSGINIYNSSISVLLSSVIMERRFTLRFRCPGDTIRYGGMTRDVRKLFNEAHIPPPMRLFRPVIEDEEGIVWIPGFPPRDSAVKPPAGLRMIWYTTDGSGARGQEATFD